MSSSSLIDQPHLYAERASGRRRRKPFNPHNWTNSIPNLRSKILLLGVSYPSVSHTIRAYNTLDSKVNLFHVQASVEQAVELVRRGVLTEMDGRDLARCLALEAHNDTHAYTVSMESGAIYGSRHLNANFNRANFVKVAKERWGAKIRFRQIILDYFWIPRGSWVMQHWSRSFFETTLCDFVREGILDFSPGSPRVDEAALGSSASNSASEPPELEPYANLAHHTAAALKAFSSGMGGCAGVVYLPFCLHCIKHVVASYDNLSRYYTISFLYRGELFEHSLWAATSTIDKDAMQNWLGKARDQEETYCTFEPSEFLSSADDEYVHKEQVLEVLRCIEDFKEVRMIRLKALKMYDPHYNGKGSDTRQRGDKRDTGKRKRSGLSFGSLSNTPNGIDIGGFVGLKHPDHVQRGFDFERMKGKKDKKNSRGSIKVPSKLIVSINGEEVSGSVHAGAQELEKLTELIDRICAENHTQPDSWDDFTEYGYDESNGNEEDVDDDDDDGDDETYKCTQKKTQVYAVKRQTRSHKNESYKPMAIDVTIKTSADDGVDVMKSHQTNNKVGGRTNCDNKKLIGKTGKNTTRKKKTQEHQTEHDPDTATCTEKSHRCTIKKEESQSKLEEQQVTEEENDTLNQEGRQILKTEKASITISIDGQRDETNHESMGKSRIKKTFIGLNQASHKSFSNHEVNVNKISNETVQTSASKRSSSSDGITDHHTSALKERKLCNIHEDKGIEEHQQYQAENEMNFVTVKTSHILAHPKKGKNPVYNNQKIEQTTEVQQPSLHSAVLTDFRVSPMMSSSQNEYPDDVHTKQVKNTVSMLDQEITKNEMCSFTTLNNQVNHLSFSLGSSKLLTSSSITNDKSILQGHMIHCPQDSFVKKNSNNQVNILPQQIIPFQYRQTPIQNYTNFVSSTNMNETTEYTPISCSVMQIKDMDCSIGMKSLICAPTNPFIQRSKTDLGNINKTCTVFEQNEDYLDDDRVATSDAPCHVQSKRIEMRQNKQAVAALLSIRKI